MKRWLLMLLLPLLASTASANSWLDTRTDYYVAARVKMGLTTATSGFMSDTRCSLLFSEAATLILPINRGVKRLTQIVTSYRENTYALDSTLVGIEGVWFDSSGHVKTLLHLPVNLWGQQAHESTDGTPSKRLTRPSYYDYTDSLLLIYPSPTQARADTITVMGWHRVADVDTATAPTIIPERYRLAILYHMVWNQAKARGDTREAAFKEELIWALSQIGLKMTGGGQAVESGD